MNAIELSRNLFETYGLPMLKRDFPAELSQIACGIAGRGSDSFGFDDEVSRDHDFEAGFSLWLTDEMEERAGFRLNRDYRKLAENFPQIKSEKSLYGVSEKDPFPFCAEFCHRMLMPSQSGSVSQPNSFATVGAMSLMLMGRSIWPGVISLP